MQQEFTTLENKILQDIEIHKVSWGNIKEMVENGIKRDYTTYHTYVRNAPDLIAPSYMKISNYVMSSGINRKGGK